MKRGTVQWHGHECAKLPKTRSTTRHAVCHPVACPYAHGQREESSLQVGATLAGNVVGQRVTQVVGRPIVGSAACGWPLEVHWMFMWLACDVSLSANAAHAQLLGCVGNKPLERQCVLLLPLLSKLGNVQETG